MQIATYQINDIGLQEIHDFLKKNHKFGDLISQKMLYAWADEAERQANMGNPPAIEIKSWDSLSGATTEFIVSPAAVDIDLIEEDE